LLIDNKIPPLWYNHPHCSTFLNVYKAPRARPLFFIGSGLSIGAGLPTWRDLLLRLATASRDEQLVQRVTALLDSVEPTRYLRVGTLLHDAFFVLGEGSDNLWRQELTKLLAPQSLLTRPSLAHDVLVSLNWHRIITTNYDCLLEAAIRRSDIDDVLVSNPWNSSRFRLESARGPCIYKIHGDIADPNSRIVLTERDYEDLYSEQGVGIFERTLGSLLRSATVVLFLGYGHGDEYVHDIIRRSMEWVSTRNVFALVPTDDYTDTTAFSNHLDNLSSELGINFIPYNSANNHEEFLGFLEFLRDPDNFSYQYVSGPHTRRPTIITLYCGGTIGAELQDTIATEVLGVTVRESRFDPELARFSRRLLDWHSQLYNAGDEVRLDIEWEILSPEQQILSENATPGIWNAIVQKVADILFKYFYGPDITADGQLKDGRLLDIFEEEKRQYAITHDGEMLNKRRFISDLNNRYILGIVVLHGTDTLAYTAPALAFALHNLPCPVVLTGANHPPIDQNLSDLSFYYVTSDAWRNLMLSLYFLESFGHRLTETFVCFGDTVHNALNLRKVPLDVLPLSKDPGARQHEEPFVFRNQLLDRQYMFKMIDGLFCNNYYSEGLFFTPAWRAKNPWKHAIFAILGGSP